VCVCVLYVVWCVFFVYVVCCVCARVHGACIVEFACVQTNVHMVYVVEAESLCMYA
jgi:hypothetical protein